MPLITHGDRTATASAQARSALTPGQAFDIVAPIDLTAVFHKWGPFPGVQRVRDQTGSWDAVGQTRTLEFSDGTDAHEELIEFEPGRSFAYELTGLSNAIGRMVQGVRGEWSVAPDGPGSVVRWTWEFLPRARMLPVIQYGIVPIFRRYMQRSVDAVVAEAANIARRDGGSAAD